MANRFCNPDDTFFDNTGAILAGGQLFFYSSGTSSKLTTYSNSGLTIANANPVVLDSAGRLPSAIFLQNAQYKVVLAPAGDTDPPSAPIWTQDPVYTSDYSTVAQVQSVAGSPNGILAGTAGSSTTPASMAWDRTNNLLYVCTTTGSASTAVWTAVNASTAAAVVPPPQGYLTPTSGTPIITGDVIAATTIYYTPYTGTLVPIYNGTTLIPTSIVSELSYTLTSSIVANNIYDCFIFLNGGVATLGTGPSWSAGTGGNITAGSCARGTGSGGTALARINGIWTNAASMTIRYGNGTVTATVAANQATYVGSLFADGSNGQVSCYRTWGQSRKWGIWNAYNRAPLTLLAGDNTASWSYTTDTIRAANGNSANSLTTFCGLAEEVITAETIQVRDSTNDSGGATAATSATSGVGFNSTTAYSGSPAYIGVTTTGGASSTIRSGPVARYICVPSLGISTLTLLEKGNSGGTNFYGTQANNVLYASYRA